MRNALALRPTRTDLMEQLAERRKRAGDNDEAISLLETAAALRPDLPHLAEQLAFALIRKGELIAADLWYARAAGRQARRPELRRWMHKQAKALLLAARQHESQARLDEALKAYVQAVGHAPDLIELRLETAEFLLGAGRYEAAEAYLEAAPDGERVAALRALARELRLRHPGRRSARFGGALYRTALNDLAAGRAVLAETALREITLMFPHYAPAWAVLRAARLALGQPDRAATTVQDWTAADPSAGGVRAIAVARPVSARGLLFDLHDRFRLMPKEKALAQVHSPAELKRTPDSYLVIDPGGDTVEARPFFEVDDDHPPPQLHITRSPSFIIGLDNAIVAGRGAVISQKGEIIADQFFAEKAEKYSAAAHRGHVVFDAAFGEEPIRPDFVDEEVFLCMGPTDRAYGDWLNQFPPRLMLAEAAELDCPILLKKETPPQYLDMLEALGVPRSRMMFQRVPRAIAFRKVYAPSWPYGRKNRPIRNWLDIYRRAARPPASGERPRLYLTRRFVGNRPLVNEEEIRELFLGHGFREIVPERLSFPEMLEAFSSPACVAGPWGSAFQSLAFCHAPPVALALIPPYNDKYMRSVGTYMDACGVRFGYAVGEIVEHRHGPNADPWRISLDKAKRALERTLELVEREEAP